MQGSTFLLVPVLGLVKIPTHISAIFPYSVNKNFIAEVGVLTVSYMAIFRFIIPTLRFCLRKLLLLKTFTEN